MHITIVFHAVVILVHFVAVYLDVPADILEQLKRLTEGLDALTKWKEEVHCVVCVLNEDLHVNRLPSTPWQIVLANLQCLIVQVLTALFWTALACKPFNAIFLRPN